MRCSVTYIISDIYKSVAFEWVAEELRKNNCEPSFILLNPGLSPLENYLRTSGFRVVVIRCRGKRDWISAFCKLNALLRKWKPLIVHCHLMTASILGLMAARMAGVRHRIYTRHHSSLHHVYFRKGVFWDKLANRFATQIVAISGVVQSILVEWEHVPEKKVKLIPHGFRLTDFVVENSELPLMWKKKNGIHDNAPVIGVVSRFTEWKGIQYVIPAFRSFLKKFPAAVLLLFNARGDYAGRLQNALDELPADSYRTIEFEEDMRSAYGAMDIFVHVPVDEHSEAFGQIYVEALAAAKPSILTLSGIAPDFIRDEENALVVPFRDSEAIYTAMLRLWEDPELRMRLAKNGPSSVKEKFDLPVMIRKLDNLYRQCLNP